MAATPSSVHHLKVTLDLVHPPVWRRLLVPSRISLGGLHDVLQVAFDWDDVHLHEFEIDGETFGIDDGESDEPIVDEDATPLGEVTGKGLRFIYVYDFGDYWSHLIEVEDVTSDAADVALPVCLAGERSAPPEDVGGAQGYEDFLERYADPAERPELVEWLGGEFDPDHFDIDAVNSQFARR